MRTTRTTLNAAGFEMSICLQAPFGGLPVLWQSANQPRESGDWGIAPEFDETWAVVIESRYRVAVRESDSAREAPEDERVTPMSESRTDRPGYSARGVCDRACRARCRESGPQAVCSRVTGGAPR